MALARAGLLQDIANQGVFDGEPEWREAFTAVPRHLFVPTYHAPSAGGWRRMWGEDPDPGRRQRWLDGVYTDTPLATRLRDGELLSSSSQPSLMARMLADLRVRDGDKVLEIGAGTGWNAALLAHRLGSDHVTTVDLDPDITDSARRHLDAAGLHPHVVTGDGARGCRADAPYDRVLATCALDTVPSAWLAQTRPGGLILTPFGTGLVRLTVHGPDHAEGRFLPTPAYFVPLRGTEPRTAHRLPPAEGVARHLLNNERFRFLLTLTAGRLSPAEALDVWQRENHPVRERFGLTASSSTLTAWLDDPEGPYRWELV
ncbi:methyltransferase domain-containing protein [Streptomyces sp. NPDC058374]|uniref:methyltransferase domain-containing protein n=1 Tax=unclassified Streptomyces TaxID=2593676 RepID=UPI00364ACA4B